MHTVLFDLSLRQEGCKFDEGLDIFEDWDFWLQVSLHTDFFYVPKATAYYRIHNSSGVHQVTPFSGESYKSIYSKWQSRWQVDEIVSVMQRNWQEVSNTALLTDTKNQLFDTQKLLSQTRNELALSQEEIQHNNAAFNAKIQSLEATLQTKIQSLEATLQMMQLSRSWRWTHFMRVLANGLRNARQLIRHHGGFSKLIAKSVKTVLRHGPKGLINAAQRATEQSISYADWIALNEPSAAAIENCKAVALSWDFQPLVSVVIPTYNSPIEFLKEAIESVKAQTYPQWQLCIADDASSDHRVQDFLKDAAARDSRISILLRTQNGHISESSNSALSIAKGEWVALLDHDDLLHPMALFELVKCLQQHPQANIVFSDEDKIDEHGVRFGPYFKPNYNPELMWAQNMISHLGCYRKSVLDDIGGFRKGFEGSQDYDLALRVIQRSSHSQIVHIPKVLYHWRAITGSTALAPSEKPYAENASRAALREHLAAIQIPAEVSASPEVSNMNRVRPSLVEPFPSISILILNQGSIESLKRCIDSIRNKSSYLNYEILVIHDSSQLSVSDSDSDYAKLNSDDMTVVHYDKPFNISAINNFAAQKATGQYLCLVSSCIEIQTADWMEEMLSFAQLAHTGAVGARIWQPGNQVLQHGGIVLGLNGLVGHSFSGIQKSNKGYFGRPVLHHCSSAVSGACLMIKKSTFMAANGMDERLVLSLNDVDLCLRLSLAGFHSVYTPHAEMMLHETDLLDRSDIDLRAKRLLADEDFFKSRWGNWIANDPNYSPNLSLDHSDFRMSPRSRVA
jgi:GT2 family glycosyltransferase